MKSSFDPLFLERIRVEYKRLKREVSPRAASAYLKDLCASENIKKATLHRHLQLNERGPRENPITVQMRQQQMNDYAKQVFEFHQLHSIDAYAMSYQVAFDVLQAKGELPDWLHMKQIYPAIQRLGLKQDAMPTYERFELPEPMNMWQMDFSKSRYFKLIGNDEAMICEPRFTKRQDDGNSLWLGIAIDDASRVMYVLYFVAPGENAPVVRDFALSAFEQKERPFLQGIPKCLYVDRGSGWISGDTREGLIKLGITQIVGTDQRDSLGRKMKKSNSQARGKVERSVETIKTKMEAFFFGLKGAGTKLSLSELNEEVSAWIEDWNINSAHPRIKSKSKWQIFEPKVAELRFPPDDARGYFTRKITKKVRNRRINLANNLYAWVPKGLVLNEGQEVEIIRDAEGWWLFHQGRRIKLTLTEDSIEEVKTNTIEVQSDAPQADKTWDEYDLREIFNAKLMEQCKVPLKRLPDDLVDDLQVWFEKRRTMAEIEDQIGIIRLTLEGRSKKPSNIIQLTSPNRYAK